MGITSEKFFNAAADINEWEDVERIFANEIKEWKKKIKQINKIPPSQRLTPKKQQTTTSLQELNPTTNQPEKLPPWKSPPRKKLRQQQSSPISSKMNMTRPGEVIQWMNDVQQQEVLQYTNQKQKPRKTKEQKQQEQIESKVCINN